MATKFWLGIADAVAQVDTVQITAFDAGTTYTITIGGVAISVVGNTDADTTASDLQAALAASTHPYFTGINFTVSTDTITMTGAVAGVPFTAASSVSGASGTIGSVTSSTACAGPCHWDVAANWSDGAIPGTGDTVYFRDNNINVCFGLDQNALAIVSLLINQTYTGKIGLDRTAFCTSADGETLDPLKPEYRQDFLRIDTDALEIGKHVGIGSATGSTRLKIDNTSTGTITTTIHNTANSAAESSLAPVRLKANSINNTVYINGGKVGLAIDEPAETCIVGNVYLNGSASKLYCGIGTEIKIFEQVNGESLIQSADTINSLTLLGGVCTTEGNGVITTVTVRGGTLYANHENGNFACITILEIYAGSVIGNRTSVTRSWSTVTVYGGSYTIDPTRVSISSTSGGNKEFTLSVSST